MPFDGRNYEAPVRDEVNPVTELLEDAWSLISKPQKWTRGQIESVDGRRMCSLTALHTAAARQAGGCGSFADQVMAMVTLNRAMAMPGTTFVRAIAAFNDSHSHREVAEAWQRAIAFSRKLP